MAPEYEMSRPRGVADQTFSISVLDQVHQTHRDQQRDVLVLERGGLLEQKVEQPQAHDERERHHYEQAEIRIDAGLLEAPVDHVGEEDDHRALGKEDDPHRPEDEAQADGRDAVHRPQEDAVDQDLGECASLQPAPPLAYVGLAHVFVCEQFLARPTQDDAPGLHDVGLVADLQGHVDVLLDQENGGALLVERDDQLEDRPRQNGAEPQGGFIDQHELRVRHDGPPDGQHLLLAAAQKTGLAVRPAP